jgi:imidazolonepropionase-like amidohydrolase
MSPRILGVLLLSAARGGPRQTPPVAEVTVLKAARIFDGKGETAARDGVVIVEGGKIRAAGSGLAAPAGARVIDLGDATLLPGFIDAHTHLSGESSDNWYQEQVNGLRRGVPETAIRATEHAYRTLQAGFTTVRDVGSSDYVDVALRNTINAASCPGRACWWRSTRWARAAATATSRGSRTCCSARRPGSRKAWPAAPPGFRDAVRMQIKYGADVIKTCATGGVLSLADDVDTAQLTQEEMDAIVEEAHRLRRKTAAHAHGAEGAKVAIRAGIDSIEHGSFLDDEAVRMMKERGTYLVPTLMAGEYITRPERQYPPEIAAKAKAARAARSAAFQRAVKAGVKVAFGTDSGVSPHGRNAEEFALLVDHGLSPAAALRTATSVGAGLLGLDGRLGTLEAGKEADVIAVPGDPLADIRATERVLFVMRGGKVYRNDRARP